MGIFKQFFDRRIAHRRRVQFQKGFDFAAGELLRGTTPEQIDAYNDVCPFESGFDDGVIAAVAQWHQQFTPVEFASTEFMPTQPMTTL